MKCFGNSTYTDQVIFLLVTRYVAKMFIFAFSECTAEQKDESGHENIAFLTHSVAAQTEFGSFVLRLWGWGGITYYYNYHGGASLLSQLSRPTRRAIHLAVHGPYLCREVAEMSGRHNRKWAKEWDTQSQKGKQYLQTKLLQQFRTESKRNAQKLFIGRTKRVVQYRGA